MIAYLLAYVFFPQRNLPVKNQGEEIMLLKDEDLYLGNLLSRGKASH